MRKVLLATAMALGIASGAQAADLAAPRTPIAAAVVAPAFNWTGFYVGAHIGYGWGRTGWTYVVGLNTVPSNPKGVFGGLQLGYNWQFNNLVLGVETDISAAGFRDNDPCPNPVFVCSSRSNWVGTTRLRAGVAADRALFYVTGGLAYGDTRVATDNGLGTFGSTTLTRVGYAVGAGMEYAFAQNWTVKAEYLYYNLGAATYTVDGGLAVRARFDNHTVRVGVNYLFSTGPSAVVARY
jgi:outer membrane immunogenic protein